MNLKLPNPTHRKRTTLKLRSKSGGSSLRFSLLFICRLIFVSISAHAQTVQWDANGLGLGSDGSGGWEDGTNWLAAGVDGPWPGTGNARVGFGTPGNYLITLSQNEIASTLTNTTSGYTFAGSDLSLTTGTGTTTPAFYTRSC